MRKLTLIITVALFFSCGNPKAKIVEQIKSYKDSSTIVAKSILQLTINDTKKYEELFSTNGDVDLKKLQNSKINREYQDYHNKIEDEKGKLKSKTAHFKSKIDSLELELKKY
jgi:hypothetical protein